MKNLRTILEKCFNRFDGNEYTINDLDNIIMKEFDTHSICDVANDEDVYFTSSITYTLSLDTIVNFVLDITKIDMSDWLNTTVVVKKLEVL